MKVLATALVAAGCASAISLDLNSADSKKAAAKTVANGLLNYYAGKTDPAAVGLLPAGYYWWEAGAMFGALIDYWRYTGDSSYVNLTTVGMLSQVGSDDNYMPIEQAKQLGNDDQAFWGMAAMAAAEYNFPNPPSDKPQWLALAQAVFTTQVGRWDNATCEGGLRWQVFPFNNGYNYKNTISNGCFFNLAARLHAYTGNTTYLEWARTSWDWTRQIGLINEQYQYWDGTDANYNCAENDHTQWSYNPAIHMHGLAVLYNMTSDPFWKTQLDGTWQGLKVFFTSYNGSSDGDNKIAYEAACEPGGNCNTDQQSFKAYLARWMAATLKITPHLADDIRSYIYASAAAAAKSCVGGTDGVTCGTKWYVDGWDGTYGVGQQLGALEMIQSTLIDSVRLAYTNTTGGTSVGDYNAGTGADVNPLAPAREITTADKAGAGILTILVVAAWVIGAWWMVRKEIKKNPDKNARFPFIIDDGIKSRRNTWRQSFRNSMIGRASNRDSMLGGSSNRNSMAIAPSNRNSMAIAPSNRNSMVIPSTRNSMIGGGPANRNSMIGRTPYRDTVPDLPDLPSAGPPPGTAT